MTKEEKAVLKDMLLPDENNDEEYGLHSEFDMEKHMETFNNYLEVIILPSGKIEYAVPSHQEKLIKIGMQKFHKTRDEFQKMCPREYWLDYMVWLCKMTGCVAVWNSRYEGEPNRLQMHQLETLKYNNLLWQ